MDITTLYQLLSDQTRLRILLLLSKQELCVCELTELLDESQPKISKHIAKLRTHNLVISSRNEQYIYYSLNYKNAALIKHLHTTRSIIQHDHPYVQDNHRLESKTTFVCTKE